MVLGKRKLGYDSVDVLLVLEKDGTVVDDEDYFQTLDDNTTFLLLKNTEKYLRRWEHSASGMTSDLWVAKNGLTG